MKFPTIRVLEKQQKRGFTLIEILVSTGILAFALCAILLTYSSCLVLATTSKNNNISTNAALGLMEEIRSDSFTRIFIDYNGLIFTLNDIPKSIGVVSVDKSNPELLQVTLVICWRQGNKVIGEDTNLNGVLDAGEDTNNNGIMDSPVRIVSLIANR